MPMRLRERLPEFPESAAWLNGETSGAALVGRPAIVHFWSFGCDCCGDVLPVAAGWRERFAGRLHVVGVHVPRTEAEKDIGAVKAAVARYGLRHPVLIDNDGAASARFRNEKLPCVYLFDETGALRHIQAGDRGFDLIERRIVTLLELNRSERKG